MSAHEFLSEFDKDKLRSRKGIKWPLESRRKFSESQRGEGGNNWKGDSVGYRGLHRWVKQQLGSANHCISQDDTCSEKFEWSNISHEYRRDLTDWQSLCQSHHLKYDDKERDSKGRFKKKESIWMPKTF